MMTAPHSRRQKVALLGVEMEAIRRKNKQWLLNVPGHLAPASAAQSMDMVRPSTNGDADVAAFVARRRCCAVLAGNNVDERIWRRGMTDSEYEEIARNDPHCRYCAVTNAFNRVRSGPTTTTTPSYKKVGGTHNGTLTPKFDTETFVTEVTITGHEIECSWDIAEKVLEAADPRNWKKFGDDFFLNSDPGRWEHGQWYPGPWQSLDGGDLLEVTRFDVNEDVTAEVHNILNISEFKSAPKKSISYNYSLRHCLKSNLGLAWEYGGLDLDAGHYTANVVDNEKGGALVRIGASKSVRYTRPRNNPAIGTFYNLLAPATISLLMRHLVYESVDKLKTPQTAGQSPTANKTANEMNAKRSI